LYESVESGIPSVCAFANTEVVRFAGRFKLTLERVECARGRSMNKIAEQSATPQKGWT